MVKQFNIKINVIAIDFLDDYDPDKDDPDKPGYEQLKNTMYTFSGNF